MMKPATIFGLMLAGIPSAAVSQAPPQTSGAALITQCQDNDPRCGAYLTGVLDATIVARKSECGVPRNDPDALRAAYLRWANENPYFASVDMIAGAQKALETTWPCRTNASNLQ
jgi:hypothetical protein